MTKTSYGTGLQGMADRVAALGEALAVRRPRARAPSSRRRGAGLWDGSCVKPNVDMVDRWIVRVPHGMPPPPCHSSRP
jgi:hypothetical protein